MHHQIDSSRPINQLEISYQTTTLKFMFNFKMHSKRVRVSCQSFSFAIGSLFFRAKGMGQAKEERGGQVTLSKIPKSISRGSKGLGHLARSQASFHRNSKEH